MTPETQEALSKHEVVLHCHRPEQVRLNPLGAEAKMHFEPYVQLREGLYDVRHIGAYSYLGGGHSVFRHIGRIGRFCAISGGIITGQAEHGMGQLSIHPLFSGNWTKVWPHVGDFYDRNSEVHRKSLRTDVKSVEHRNSRIEIGNDVWLGYGVFIRRGVKVGDGAVVAAHSVLVSDVPPYAVVGGNPAKVIKYRFPPDVIEQLVASRWWDKGLSAVTGLDWTEPAKCARELAARCRDLPDWSLPLVSVDAAGVVLGADGKSWMSAPASLPEDIPHSTNGAAHSAPTPAAAPTPTSASASAGSPAPSAEAIQGAAVAPAAPASSSPVSPTTPSVLTRFVKTISKALK